MNILHLLRQRFAAALDGLIDQPQSYLDLVLPSQDPRFGDYQANCAMPMAKELKKSPREIAAAIVHRLDVADLCDPPQPEIAGPGFINLRLKDGWLSNQLMKMSHDRDRLGIASADSPKTYVIDYSSPNVAKPMHVGHIRSTVIGDALYRILRFLGHRTISDNHLGDWGTQFGTIIFGYKHFLDVEAYREAPVEELCRLYKLVHQLVEYHDAKKTGLPELEARIAEQRREMEPLASALDGLEKPERKKTQKKMRQAEARLAELEEDLAAIQDRIAGVENHPTLRALAESYPDIGQQVLDETAALHAGDKFNTSLWNEFLPPCLEAIDGIYQRLGVSFNHTLGESFYHDRLASVVEDLKARGLATESEGATCVFLDGMDAPMIVQKKDGAFLYATTDLATIAYRVETFQPDVILYVVDHRQSLHFEQLFAAARKWGHESIGLVHVRFGTVLGEDGKPYKTRSGDAVELEGLLDRATERAYQIVCENDATRQIPILSESERRRIAEQIGIGAIKYADLSHNRESDYIFSYDKMLAMNGNTAAYMQYCYARVNGIFSKGDVDIDASRSRGDAIQIGHPAERALGLELVRFAETLDRVVADYRPNHLTAYLFSLAGRFAEFYEACPVHNAPDDATRHNRLLLCDLVARTIQLGLGFLGIDVVERM
ncbi:MAG: arginine--tRNA ligase [Pirellulales bacterium]|nr:arginine--tRNA ligase [Pirellulales bacterium]